MRAYLGTDSRSTTDDMTATHATVRHLTCRVEGLGHKLFMDNFFSSPRLFDDLLRCKIHSCGTVWPNRKDMPSDFRPKKLKLTKGDERVRTRGNLTALAWKDRCHVYMLIWTRHQKKEIFVMTANKLWSLKLWQGITGTWVTSTILIVWRPATQCVDVTSIGPWNCFSIFWI